MECFFPNSIKFWRIIIVECMFEVITNVFGSNADGKHSGYKYGGYKYGGYKYLKHWKNINNWRSGLFINTICLLWAYGILVQYCKCQTCYLCSIFMTIYLKKFLLNFEFLIWQETFYKLCGQLGAIWKCQQGLYHNIFMVVINSLPL